MDIKDYADKSLVQLDLDLRNCSGDNLARDYKLSIHRDPQRDKAKSILLTNLLRNVIRFNNNYLQITSLIEFSEKYVNNVQSGRLINRIDEDHCMSYLINQDQNLMITGIIDENGKQIYVRRQKK